MSGYPRGIYNHLVFVNYPGRRVCSDPDMLGLEEFEAQKKENHGNCIACHRAVVRHMEFKRAIRELEREGVPSFIFTTDNPIVTKEVKAGMLTTDEIRETKLTTNEIQAGTLNFNAMPKHYQEPSRARMLMWYLRYDRNVQALITLLMLALAFFLVAVFA